MGEDTLGAAGGLTSPGPLLHCRPVLKRIGIAVVVPLLAFHAWLLGGLVVDGRLADPERLLRWAVALALLAALAAASRTPDRKRRRLQMCALWILAALLHAPAISDGLDAFDVTSAPSVAILTGAIAPGFVGWMIAAAFLAFFRPSRAVVSRPSSLFVVSSLRVSEPSSSPFAARPPTGSQISFLN